MSNSYQNSLNAGVSANLSLKEKQIDNQKKENLKLLQQKYPNSMNIPNSTKQLYLLQQLQQQQLQQRQLQQQQLQQQQQLIYNKIQNKRKIDREKMLDTYIYDYCIKRDYKQTAELIKKEAKISTEDIKQINSEGFLYEWWTVFWEIYSAKENNEEDTTPEALTYINIQNLKAKQNELLRQMNSVNSQKGVNSNSLTSQLLNPQLKQLQQMQLQHLQKGQSSTLPQQSQNSQQLQASAQQSAVQQLQQQLQNKQNQGQTQSHSNSSSSILNSNQNHSSTLNNSNSIIPLSANPNTTSGTVTSKNPQLSTSSSPQFNINGTLTSLMNNSTYSSQNLPNTSRAQLVKAGSIVQPQQPTQSPHLSTNPSPQLAQGILRNSNISTASLSNPNNLQNIGGNSASAALNLYTTMKGNSSNISLQDKSQLLSQSQLMKMVQNKVLNQMKQQQKTGLNSTNATAATNTANTTVQNSSLGITNQINTSNINNVLILKKSAMSPTDTSQDMSPPPPKRLRSNNVQYSPILTKNTIQSPVLTTQQQNISVNASPVMNANSLLNDISASQLIGKDWSIANNKIRNQQLQSSTNLLLRRQSQIQQLQQPQLGLQNTETQELLLQQKAIQARTQGLKNSKAQIQYNLKLQQQSQSSKLSMQTTNSILTSTNASNFQSLKAANITLPQSTLTSEPQTNMTTIPSTTESADLKQNSLLLPQENSINNQILINNSIINTTNFDTKSQADSKTIPSTSSQATNPTKTSNEQIQLSSLLQNPTNDNIGQLLQNTIIDHTINDTDVFNKSMELILNFPQQIESFDENLNKTEFKTIDNNNNNNNNNNKNNNNNNNNKNNNNNNNNDSNYDSFRTITNENETGVDEDPEKIFPLPVESVFYGTGSNLIELPEKQNELAKKSKFYQSYNPNNLQILTPLNSLQGHKQKVSVCAFNSTGNTLASGSNDNKVIIWDVSNINVKPSQLWTLEGHKKTVNVVSFCNLTNVVGNAITPQTAESILNNIPSLLVTGSIDKTVRIWKLNGLKKNGTVNAKESYEMLSVFEDHNWGVTAADFCPIGVCNSQNVDGFGEVNKKVNIYCGSLDAEGELKVWNIVNKKILKSVKLNKSSKFDYLSNPLKFRPVNNGSNYASDSIIVSIVAAYATSLIVVDFLLPYNNINEDSTEDYTIRTRQTDHKKYISTLEWTNDGHNLVTASEDIIYVWNIDSNNEFQIIYSISSSENEKICSCIILPDPYRQQTNALTTTNNIKILRIAYSAYGNIYIWELDKTGKTMYSQYTQALGKVSTYSKAHAGTICSLSSCLRPKSIRNKITEGPMNDIILASSSNSKENNLKLWCLNL